MVLAVPMLLYSISFAAGARINVVVDELIRESLGNDNVDLAAFRLIFGFAVMMVLDVALA